MTYHTSVLPKEVIEYLSPQKDEWYLDATLGDGGHTLLLRQHDAKVWAIDQDEEAIKRASQRLSGFDQRDSLILTRGNFAKLEEIWKREKLPPLSGVLFDLGTSTLQLTSPTRGFSFTSSAPLDMRMDQSLTATAADLVNALSESELTRLFGELGGEQRAKSIARGIVNARSREAIATTDQLAKLIARIKPQRGRLHPATKVFQALRMAVNGERAALKAGLAAAIKVLKSGGRLVIISFHEGEDTIVKHALKELEEQKIINQLTDKPVTPSEEELAENIRARSAKLRAATKI